MRVSYLGLLFLRAVLLVGLAAAPGPADAHRVPPRSANVRYVSPPGRFPSTYPVTPGRAAPPRMAVPPRPSYTPPYRSPTLRPTIPYGPGYPGYIGPRIATVYRGASFAAAVNRFNRPWWRYHYAWYYGGWYNWPAYPALWANMPGAYWLTPWWTGSAFLYDNPYYLYVLYPTNNPYVLGVPRGLDYSVPLPVPADTKAERMEPASVNAAVACMDRAREHFKAGQYADATAEMNRAVGLLPGDRSMQEFRALTLFARGEYDAAASVLYAVLAAGPGWNWETMARLYPNVQTYTAQLRSLEAYVRDHSGEGRGHFLLGYHYLVLNDLDAAVGELRTAAKLSPRDKVSAAIVDALSR